MYGNTIKSLMNKHSFDSVYELAKESGVTAMGISNIINNDVKKPHRTTIKKLAEVFDLTVIQLKDQVKAEQEKYSDEG